MKISVIVAMEKEFSLLSRALKNNSLNGHTISLNRCGMGKVNAAVGATEIILREKPDLIISSGVAGSCRKDVKTMDFVVGAQVAYHDVWCGPGNAMGQVQDLPAVFEAPAAICSAAMSVPCTCGTLHCGLIASGDRFIETHEEVEAIRSLYPGALAVDMESGALAQTCFLKGVPFLSIRLISDGDEDNRYASYADFWDQAGENSFTFIKSFIEAL